MIDVLVQKKQQIGDLCRKHKVAHLAVFGSARTGEFDPAKSDFDFAVEFQTMSPADHLDAYFGLLFDLEAALGRKVDLVEIKAVENQVFLGILKAEQESVYDAA